MCEWIVCEAICAVGEYCYLDDNMPHDLPTGKIHQKEAMSYWIDQVVTASSAKPGTNPAYPFRTLQQRATDVHLPPLFNLEPISDLCLQHIVVQLTEDDEKRDEQDTHQDVEHFVTDNDDDDSRPCSQKHAESHLSKVQLHLVLCSPPSCSPQSHDFV
jgi:hypothetical protein